MNTKGEPFIRAFRGFKQALNEVENIGNPDKLELSSVIKQFELTLSAIR